VDLRAVSGGDEAHGAILSGASRVPRVVGHGFRYPATLTVRGKQWPCRGPPQPLHEHPITMELTSPSGLRATFDERGTLLGLMHGDIAVNLFVGNPLDGGRPSSCCVGTPTRSRARRCSVRAARRAGASIRALRSSKAPANGTACATASRFGLAAAAPAWFWHVAVENASAAPLRIDLMYLQDLALAPYAAVRMNEYYVSQYIDHTPLDHHARGSVLASRQNQAAGGRHPWCLIGSLNRAVAHCDRRAAGARPVAPRRPHSARAGRRPAVDTAAARARDGRVAGHGLRARRRRVDRARLVRQPAGRPSGGDRAERSRCRRRPRSRCPKPARRPGRPSGRPRSARRTCSRPRRCSTYSTSTQPTSMPGSTANGATSSATPKAASSASSTAGTGTSCCARRSSRCCGRTATCCAPARTAFRTRAR
jgi:hypothetical protein